MWKTLYSYKGEAVRYVEIDKPVLEKMGKGEKYTRLWAAIDQNRDGRWYRVKGTEFCNKRTAKKAMHALRMKRQREYLLARDLHIVWTEIEGLLFKWFRSDDRKRTMPEDAPTGVSPWVSMPPLRRQILSRRLARNDSPPNPDYI